jgi:N-acetylmuramoyl-L-alanine amidase
LVSKATFLRSGDRGDPVRDVQQRLVAAGLRPPVDGIYGESTVDAVAEFQTRRGVRVDGICGPETWAELIESGYALGDRLLYLCQPMLRGDDVGALQTRLNALGFDAGREDGIFGQETEAAVANFQRDAGLAADKVCGPETIRALERLGSLAGGSVATVREREGMRRSRSLRGMRIFVASDLGIAALASAVAAGLRGAGAEIVLDPSGEDAALVAQSANRFEAEAFVALTSGAASGARCAFFANQTFRSPAGYCLALRMTAALREVLPNVDEPIGRTYRLLRETRMPAVVCEVVASDDAAAMAALSRQLPAVANAVVVGMRRGVEEPVDAPV